jgi:di/tricarboxylate transporter
MLDAYLLFLTLAVTIALFIWGYWRYDTVALLSLICLVILGVIPSNQAFIGFSNPAVITVACVMIITTAISQTGIIERIVKYVAPLTHHDTLHISVLCVITAVLSAFMNNVGALALMMPLAIQTAINSKLSPSYILMPLSFASVLGGLTTKIGTPPNLLISAYKEQVDGTPFSMFDFSPVGISVAIIGLLYICLIGWRFIPQRRKASKTSEDLYQMQDYISELSIPSDSPIIGMKRIELERFIDADIAIIGLIRGKRKMLVIPPHEVFQEKDILIVEASHEDLQNLIIKGRFELVHGEVISPEKLRGEDIAVLEAVVTPGSRIEKRSWQRMRIRSRLNINLLAIARAGRAIKNRLNHVKLNAGDVVLVQGNAETLQENIVNLGLVPLAERNVNVGFRRKALLPIALFIGAIFLASLQILEVSIAFLAAIVLMVIFNIIPMRLIYKSIEWPIIVLLAAFIPVGGALQSTGAAQLITNFLFSLSGPESSLLIIVLILVITMTLSDLMNNAATAVVMSPIAANMAQSMNLPIEPFLMAVAVGASCSFLTPISHQNNTLVMGPGGYKFFDYLRLGIPLEIIVAIASIPLIYWIWL